ncbi:MAG: glutathione peroxidase [Rhodobacteraceae bacterium]|nr:glutathione peroxidase [Paracoccaceae bacterium]
MRLSPSIPANLWAACLWATCVALALLVSPAAAREVERPVSAHDFTFTSIDGAPLALADFAGRPIIVVNTASRCGFTGQYAGLQEIWERYRGQGLMVIGAPSQDFNQELASEAEVKQFCEVNFDLDFPMTEIIGVKGAGAHPFYAWAAEQAGAPRWNFNKYLIDGEGRLIERLSSSDRPTGAEVLGWIESELAP